MVAYIINFAKLFFGNTLDGKYASNCVHNYYNHGHTDYYDSEYHMTNILNKKSSTLRNPIHQKNNIRKIFIIMVLCLSLFGTVEEANATLLWDGWFGATDHQSLTWHDSSFGYPLFITENSAWDPEYGSGNACMWRTNSATTVSASTLGTENRPGYALRLNVQDGDSCDTSDPANNIRVNLLKKLDYSLGYDAWYSVSIYIPAGYYKNPATWGSSLVGWFDNVYMPKKNGDNIHLNPLWGTSGAFGILEGAVQGVNSDVLTYPIGTMTEGWHDFLIHYKWSTGTDGFVYYYYDGNLVGSITNRVTVPPASNGKYNFVVSMYEGVDQPNHYLYFYNLKMGTTRGDVEYNAGSIAPTPTSPASTPIPAPNRDTTAPNISSVSSSSIASTSATISWTTNEASDAQVEYGITVSSSKLRVT